MFKVYTERLKIGNVQTIDEVTSSDFLNVFEKDLTFTGPVIVKGEVSIPSHELLFKLKLEATAVMPCSICNEPTHVPILVKDLYADVPLDEIIGAVYDYGHFVREEILLGVPLSVECHDGHCPQRETIEKFLKKPKENEEEFSEEELYYPFANLQIDESEENHSQE